jgi:hypothetical protein
MRSWVQVLETTFCRNTGKTAYIRPKVVGSFPGLYASGSYVHRDALFIIYFVMICFIAKEN